jgi:phosphoglycolate phosphatase-like HAD superfamily hydrolase
MKMLHSDRGFQWLIGLYSDAIEACYQEAGRAARGPAFLDFLKRQVRSEEAALDAVYNARIAYLGSFPELAATLRNAQRPGYTFATRTARTYEPSNEQTQMNLFRIVY